MEHVENQDVGFPVSQRKAICAELVAIRKLLGLQAKDVARDLNIEASNFSNIERGKWNFGVDTLISIVDYYGFDLQIVIDASKVNLL